VADIRIGVVIRVTPVFDAIVSRIGGVVPRLGFPLTGRARVLRHRADRERTADVNFCNDLP
jgi:hypothetical protein